MVPDEGRIDEGLVQQHLVGHADGGFGKRGDSAKGGPQQFLVGNRVLGLVPEFLATGNLPIRWAVYMVRPRRMAGPSAKTPSALH